MGHFRLLILVCMLMAGFSSVHCHAQSRAFGGVLSFSGVDLSYQHYARDSVFVEIGAGLDFDSILDGRALLPGAKVSFTCNFIFFRREYASGIFDLYAGPGVTAGFVRQKEYSLGPMAGFCGKIGLEYRFNVPVILSLDFSPVLGLHMHSDDGQTVLRLYENGLRYSYYPRLGIRYRFGKP